jgi:ankyrin repeat protein
MEAIADVRIVDAARTGNTDLVRSMLESGISVNSCRNLTRETALHVACFFNHSDVLKLLVDAGASINAVTRSHFTPLHYAADSGHLEDYDLQLLLLAGAEVTARDVDGNTPLHTSARMGRLNTFRVLALEGARMYARELSGCSHLTASNNAGESPLSLVESRHSGTELHVWAMAFHQNMKAWCMKLKRMCRYAILHAVGHKRLSSIDQLPLPKQLKEYLKHPMQELN